MSNIANTVENLLIGTMLSTIDDLMLMKLSKPEREQKLLEDFDHRAIATKRQLEVINEAQAYVSNFITSLQIPEEAPEYVKVLLRVIYERIICEDSSNEGQSN